MKAVHCYILFLFSAAIFAQDLTEADYQRALSFTYAKANNKLAFNMSPEVNWIRNDSSFYFIYYQEGQKDYMVVDPYKGIKRLLFDHERLASALSAKSGNTIDHRNIQIKRIDVHADSLYFAYDLSRYAISLQTYEITESTFKRKKSQGQASGVSPDGKWTAFVKEYNLFIKSNEENDTIQLTFDGQKNYENASYYGWFDKMKGENGDRPKRFSVSWSPDSKYLTANLVDLRNASKMYMLDHSEEDKFRPSLYSYYRGSPGDTNMVYTRTKIFDIEKQSEVSLSLPRRTHINALSTSWTEESGKLVGIDLKRGFQTNRILWIDAVGETVDELMVEESPTNIDKFWHYHFEKANKIAFLSARSGWDQIYLLDIESKEIKPLTQGNFVVNRVISIDEEGNQMWLAVSGKDDEMNPYHQQIYKLNLDGDFTLLTEEKYHHEVNFSPDKQFFIDTYSDVSSPSKTVLRSSLDGKIILEIATANVDAFKVLGWKAPMTFSLTGKDGKTPIYGAIWRPTSFDPGKRYPIIDHSYTGPHTQVFPKSFRQTFSNQALAELGFCVIMIDGLGTAGRSKEFLNHSYKDMGSNLEDHVLAIKTLGEKYPWIDLEKVGIFGHSAGGYDAGHGMLAFPDFYKVGVASSADHDFRMEKAWWPEMYMGWPVDSTYHEVSNITLAKNLKGKLLLVHGNMDDNVNVSATYKLAEELIKADKEFDLLILPSQRHGYQGDYRKYFIKKRWNYFVENLLEVKPLWDFDWD